MFRWGADRKLHQQQLFGSAPGVLLYADSELGSEQHLFNSRSLYLRTADLPTVANIVLRVSASTGAEEVFSVSAH